MDIFSNNFYYRLFLCSKVANFAFDKSTQAQMKRFLTILAFLLAGTLVASAQNIIVGEKIPCVIHKKSKKIFERNKLILKNKQGGH